MRRALALAGITLVACSGGSAGVLPPTPTTWIEARHHLFRGTPGSSWPDALTGPTRWVILFQPDLANCQPREAAILRALRRIAAEFPEVKVATVLPAAGAELTTLRGEPLVGEKVVVADEAYVAEGVLAPRPRLEIWAGDGRLLLLRSLPPVIFEEHLEQEIRWARAFTAPAPEGEAR